MKNALIFGGIAGALIAIYSFVVFATLGGFESMDLERLALVETLGYLRYLILGAVVFFAIRIYQKSKEGSLNYWSLVKQGFFTALVVALCVGLMEGVYMGINPEFMDQYGSLQVQKMQAEGASLQQIAEMQRDMEAYAWMANPLFMGIFYFFETAILGSIFALIISFFFRARKQNPQLAAI